MKVLLIVIADGRVFGGLTLNECLQNVRVSGVSDAYFRAYVCPDDWGCSEYRAVQNESSGEWSIMAVHMMDCGDLDSIGCVGLLADGSVCA